jgi:DNA-binding NarL/FixJ family response regulator
MSEHMSDTNTIETVPPQLRVLLCDDHLVVLAGLEQLVTTFAGIEVCATARNGYEAIAAVERTKPHVVLMDLQMPELDGVGATRQIRQLSPATQVVILTSFSDRARIEAALDAGAIGYLLKDATSTELESAIRSAARGESPLAPRVARILVTKAEIDTKLSARERQVLTGVASGLSNKQIARKMDVAEATIKAHLTSVFRAIGVENRTQAARWLGEQVDRDGESS